MTGEPTPASRPDDEPATLFRPVVDDLRELLDLDAGLAHIVSDDHQRDVEVDLRETLDLDAGLSDITGRPGSGDSGSARPQGEPSRSSYGALFERLPIDIRLDLHRQQVFTGLRRLPQPPRGLGRRGMSAQHSSVTIITAILTSTQAELAALNDRYAEDPGWTPYTSRVLHHTRTRTDKAMAILLSRDRQNVPGRQSLDRLGDLLSQLRRIEYASRSFAGADLTRAGVSIEDVDGVLWSAGTRWPPDLVDVVTAMSVEVEPGLFEVRYGRVEV